MREHHEYTCEKCGFKTQNKHAAELCESRSIGQGKFQLNQKVYCSTVYCEQFGEYYAKIIQINLVPWSHEVRDYNISIGGTIIKNVQESDIRPAST